MYFAEIVPLSKTTTASRQAIHLSLVYIDYITKFLYSQCINCSCNKIVKFDINITLSSQQYMQTHYIVRYCR